MNNDSLRTIWQQVGDLVSRTERLEVQEPKVKGCRLINTSTTQNILASTLTALTFTTDLYNTDSNWSTGNPTRLICSSPGYYMAGGGWEVTAASSGRQATLIRLTGGAYLQAQSADITAGEDAVSHCQTGMFQMTTADYIEIVAFHTMSTTKTVAAASSTQYQHRCIGWLAKID